MNKEKCSDSFLKETYFEYNFYENPFVIAEQHSIKRSIVTALILRSIYKGMDIHNIYIAICIYYWRIHSNMYIFIIYYIYICNVYIIYT